MVGEVLIMIIVTGTFIYLKITIKNNVTIKNHITGNCAWEHD